INTIITYVQNNRTCRSKMIAEYFSKIEVKNCGICDNCINNKTLSLSADEFKIISDNITGVLLSNKLSPDILYEKMKPLSKEKFGKVLNFLLSESKLAVDRNGNVSLAN